MQLSLDQEEALDTAVDSIGKRRETVLVGPAGSGKTTLMRILIDRMRKKRRVVQACPTGKAAQRLTELTGKHASTIHKLLYREVEDTGSELFFGDPKAPCRNGELLVIDESSMVGRKIYNEVMKYLPRDSRVLWVGDAEQLEPVKDTWGPNLKRPTARLTEVHRQALNNPIIAYATAVRQDRGDEWLKENWNPEDDRIAIAKGAFPAMRWYLDSLERGADSTYITFTHKVRKAFNESVRENRKVASTRLAPGDRILVKTNRHQAGLMNGQVLTVESMTRMSRNYRNDEVYRVQVKEREQSVYINLDLIERQPREFWSWYKALPEWKQDYRLAHIWYGNCLTVHSAQGSQWDEVGFLWGDSFRRMRRRRTEKESARRFLYTAVTRSAEKLSIFSL